MRRSNTYGMFSLSEKLEIGLYLNVITFYRVTKLKQQGCIFFKSKKNTLYARTQVSLTGFTVILCAVFFPTGFGLLTPY